LKIIKEKKEELLTKDNVNKALKQAYLGKDYGFTDEEIKKLKTAFFYTNNTNSLNNFSTKTNSYNEGNIPHERYIRALQDLEILKYEEKKYSIFSADEKKSLEKVLGNFAGLEELDSEIFEKWRKAQAEYETEVVKYLAGREVFEYYSFIGGLKPEEMPEKFKEYYACYLDNMNQELKKEIISENIYEFLSSMPSKSAKAENEENTEELKAIIHNFYEKGADNLPKFINDLNNYEIIYKKILFNNEKLETEFNAELNSYFFKKSRLILNNTEINLKINKYLAKKAVVNKGSELKKGTTLKRKLSMEELLSDNELLDRLIGVPANHEFFSSEEMFVLVTAINYLNLNKYERKIEEKENLLANLLIGKTLYYGAKSDEAIKDFYSTLYDIVDNNIIFLSKIIRYNNDMFPQSMNNFWIENYDKKYELIKCLPEYFNNVSETEDDSPSITGKEILEEELVGSIKPEMMAELKKLKAAENAKKLIIPKESELSEKPAKLSALQQEILDAQKKILGEKNEQ